MHEHHQRDVVAMFDETQAAEQAARSLSASGVDAEVVRVHDDGSGGVPAAVVLAALAGLVAGAIGLLLVVAARWPSPAPVAVAVLAGAGLGFVGGAWAGHGGLRVLRQRRAGVRAVVQVAVRSDAELPAVVGVLWADGAQRLSVARPATG